MGKTFDNKSTSNRYALVGDIGGTNCRLGIMSSTGEIVERVDAINSQSMGPEKLLGVLEKLYGDSKIRFGSTGSFVGISLAIAGLINQEGGVLETAPHLENYVGFPFLNMLRKTFPGTHHVENDATAATLAEFRLGAGIGAKNMIYVAIGTGIGGGLIIEGDLYRGSGGFAGEIGHISGGSALLCSCGKYGCLEAMNSGSGIEAQLHSGALAKSYHDFNMEGTFGDSQQIGLAAQSGDLPSLEVIADVGKNIGIGLGNVVNILNPDTIIIGGGLSTLGEDLLNPIVASLRGVAFPEMSRDLKVAVGCLGDQGGMLGAGLLLFDLGKF